MNKYENHEDEWRDEERQEAYEKSEKRKWAARNHYDPSFSAKEIFKICTSCGTDIEDIPDEYDTCHACYFTDLAEELENA